MHRAWLPVDSSVGTRMIAQRPFRKHAAMYNLSECRFANGSATTLCTQQKPRPHIARKDKY